MKLLTTNYQLPTTKRGVSIYLALMIMFILITIGLGVSLIIVSQIKMIKGMGDSVVAFYAADTGIERALYEKRIVQNPNDFTLSDTVGTEANYTVTYVQTTGVAQSVGNYQGVKRAIEITHPTVFDFSLKLDPNALEFSGSPPLSNSTTVSTTLISGSDRSVTFSVSDSLPSLPSWLTYSWIPDNSCLLTNGCSKTLKFDVAAGAPSGFYDFTVTVQAETNILTKTTELKLFLTII